MTAENFQNGFSQSERPKAWKAAFNLKKLSENIIFPHRFHLDRSKKFVFDLTSREASEKC
jgi:hypothetical protein